MYKPGGYCNPKVGDQFFNKYKIIKKIGRGHFSTVWEVEEMQSNLKVAMKIQKSAKNYRLSAMEEISIHAYLSRKKHEGSKYINMMLYNNVYKGSNGKHTCMVFDLNDCDLHTFVHGNDNCVCNLETTSAIAFQILSGLDFIHSRGIIHTDLKPENILVKYIAEVPKIQIGDFGTACIDGDRSMDYLQTSHYRSPEIILRYKYWSTPIDIWSCACIFFEMLTNDYLFDGENEADLVHAMVELLGMPRSSFLNDCRSKRLYFDRTGLLLQGNICPLPLHRSLVEDYDFSFDTANVIVKLLLPMLEYDPKQRSTARNLLALYPQKEVQV